jgi:putative cell wall-binding protein
MKRMIQMLVCCVLATVLVMGSMANAMAQSMGGRPFELQPQQSQQVTLYRGQTSFIAQYTAPINTTVVVNGGSCQQQSISVPPGRAILQPYNCGPTLAVTFTNQGEAPVRVYAK